MEKKQAKLALGAYIRKGEIVDFGVYTTPEKLKHLQITPKEFIETREIQGKAFKYVQHTYAKKALNFVFNFGISNEMIKEEITEYQEKFKNYRHPAAKKDNRGQVIPVDDTRTVIEAAVTMKFTFAGENGEITRTVRASHKGYSNPATTKSNTLEAAYSKSWTKVAATFGIGAELEREFEKTMYQEEPEIETTIQEAPQATTKSFDLPY
jgi:hypothetical protein